MTHQICEWNSIIGDIWTLHNVRSLDGKKYFLALGGITIFLSSDNPCSYIFETVRGDESPPEEDTFATTLTLLLDMGILGPTLYIVSAMASENSQNRIRSVPQEGRLKSESNKNIFLEADSRLS